MGIWEDKEIINLIIILLLFDKSNLIIVRHYIINVAHGILITLLGIWRHFVNLQKYWGLGFIMALPRELIKM